MRVNRLAIIILSLIPVIALASCAHVVAVTRSAPTSPAPLSIDQIFQSRWGHSYYNNAARVSYSDRQITNLIGQLAPLIQSHSQPGVFDCSETSAYLEYVLERHGYTAEIAVGTTKIGGHAWLLVYDNQGKSWVSLEATLPITLLSPETMRLIQRDSGINYLAPDVRWATINDVTIPDEFDWWNTPFADELVRAADGIRVGEASPSLPEVKPPELPPLPPVKYPDLPPLPPVKLP